MLLWSIAAASALTAGSIDIDLTRYFPSVTVEESDRAALLARVDAFLQQPSVELHAPDRLSAWLRTYEDLTVGLQKHDAYVYVRAERNGADKADAAADEKLESEMTRLDAGVDRVLAEIGASTLQHLLDTDQALQPYQYFVTRALERAKHASQNQRAIEVLGDPTIASLEQSYKSLRQHALSVPAHSGGTQTLPAGKDGFLAKWAPYRDEENAFAGLLIPLVVAESGRAELQGFSTAAEAAYSRAGLPPESVRATLTAVRSSSATYAHYREVVVRAASKRLGLSPSEVHTWNLDSADPYSPPAATFTDALQVVLAAVRPMGKVYAQEFDRLFDLKSHRVEWCHAPGCDDAGFSVGYAGLTSGLFYGKFDGSTNSVRAVAHEAGHAVHRQLMNEHQPRAVYNRGPHFLFESFAIFNELLLLDHLGRAASTEAAKAYYAHKFLDDITFQVYGSARETELEESIYAGVRANTIRTAADLDRLTADVLSRYESYTDSELETYWASNRLYFTDPFYDVNYLFAGLLALEYLRLYEQAPREFATRYLAMLQNGFTAPPEKLLQTYLQVNLGDETKLVAQATELIRHRTQVLENLYGRLN